MVVVKMIGQKLFVLMSMPVNPILAHMQKFLHTSNEASMDDYKIFIKSFGRHQVFTRIKRIIFCFEFTIKYKPIGV